MSALSGDIRQHRSNHLYQRSLIFTSQAGSQLALELRCNYSAAFFVAFLAAVGFFAVVFLTAVVFLATVAFEAATLAEEAFFVVLFFAAVFFAAGFFSADWAPSPPSAPSAFFLYPPR